MEAVKHIIEAWQLQCEKWYFFTPLSKAVFLPGHRTPKQLLDPCLIGFHKISSVGDKAFGVSTAAPSSYSFEAFATIVGPFEITELKSTKAKLKVPRPHTDTFDCEVDKDDNITAKVDVASKAIDFIAEGDVEKVTVSLSPSRATVFIEQVTRLIEGLE